jgi:hypothetical protein
MFAGAVYAMRLGVIKTDVSATQAGFFGEGVRHGFAFLDRHVGPVSVLPAALVFSARYRLPPTAFRAATEPGEWYARGFRAEGMRFNRNTLRLGDALLGATTSGAEHSNKGIRVLPDDVGRVVFTAEWPTLTSLVVHGRGGPGCRLHVGRGGLFRDTWYGKVNAPQAIAAPLKVPSGEFDSGINEFLFHVSGKGCKAVLIEKVELKDDTVYPAPYEAQRNGTFDPADTKRARPRPAKR